MREGRKVKHNSCTGETRTARKSLYFLPSPQQADNHEGYGEGRIENFFLRGTVGVVKTGETKGVVSPQKTMIQRITVKQRWFCCGLLVFSHRSSQMDTDLATPSLDVWLRRDRCDFVELKVLDKLDMTEQ